MATKEGRFANASNQAPSCGWPQLMLACGLGMEARNRDLDWRSA